MDEEELPSSSPFAPRAALVRSPPTGLPSARASLRAEASPRTRPARPPPPRSVLPPPPPPPKIVPPGPLKRQLTSPEERRPVDVVRMCRPSVTPPASAPTAPTASAAPVSTHTQQASGPASPEPVLDSSDDESVSSNVPPSIAKASKLELLDRVHKDLDAIMAVVTGSSSRLNKDSTNTIGARVQDTLVVVAALSLRLCEMETEVGRAQIRCAALEKEALLARASPRIELRAGPVVNAQPTYSAALKLSRSAAPVPIPPAQGPVLAFYPAEDHVDTLKTAEDTKAELKRTVNPRTIDVQIQRVRKVGNAGVVVQTTTPLAADRLRSAAPPSLRVTEPRKTAPRICIRDIDGNPATDDFLAALHEQNLRDSGWTLERLRAGTKTYKMNGRQQQTTTFILECSPPLRELLLAKGKLYIGWQAAEACDFIRVTCCNKCQTFGHPEKYCRSKEVICGKCGVTGHQKPDCKEVTSRCATCFRFGRESASHSTNAKTCPARLYAEQRAVATTNYGCP